MFYPKILTTLKNYSMEQFFKDVISGIIVAIIALPLSIALAIASGVPPERGLYTAIVAGFIISLLGGSRVQIGGPTGAFMVIVYGVVMKYGIDGLIVATMMAGVISILMGLFKLGGVIKFIPYPIVTGFTSGIAVIIFSSQLNDFFGLNIAGLPGDFLGKWSIYLESLHLIDFKTMVVGLVALLVLIVWPKISKKIPGAIIAIIVSVLWVKIFNWDITTIGSKFGDLPRMLPMPSVPNVSFELIKVLLPSAFTIALLGAVESLLSAVVADGMIGGRHRSNTELMAQGIANIGSGLFGGIPATGAIARTMANINNGGRTPVAGIVHALTLLLMMVLLMPLAQMIPLSALAAILIVVAYNMSEWRGFIAFRRAPKSDLAILLVTFLLTVFVDLIKAIEIGMVLSAFLFMKRMADVSQFKMHGSEDEEDDYEIMVDENQKYLVPENVQVYEINGPFFFGAADQFVEHLINLRSNTNVLILRMRHVSAMDATALHAFKTMLKMCEKKEISVYITGLNQQPYEVIKKSNLLNASQEEHLFNLFEEALLEVRKYKKI